MELKRGISRWRRRFARRLPLPVPAILLAAAALILAPASGADDPVPDGPPRAIVLTEIHYHPPASEKNAEFVELFNRSDGPVDLSGWRFNRGIKFTFPPRSRLPARSATVVCQELQAFRAAFGEGPAVAGCFEGRLDNAGELLRLVDAAGKTVSDLRYSSMPPWPAAAGGKGPSLSRRRAERDADDPSSWTAAKPTPGAFRPEEPARDPLSLYQPRHRPLSPAIGESVLVSVSAHGAGPATRIALHYQVGRAVKSLPMAREAAAAGVAVGKDPRFSATLPPQASPCIVRYWIESEDGGAACRTPPRDAPTTDLAYQVADPGPERKLPLYQLIMEPQAFQGLEASAYQNRLWPAAFVAGGVVHDQVQVRYRGSWARTWPKKSWKIVFKKDHRFGKERRLNLNSGWHDPAFIREVLAYQVYKEAGALSLKSRLVRLHLNGAFWGLFVEVENPKKKSLARRGLRGAALYKAASRSNLADERSFPAPDLLAPHYTLETRKRSGYEELHRFTRGIAETAEPAAFFAGELDLPRYLGYLAAGALIQNWDSYNKNHFLAFDAAGSRKWEVIPWDLDRTFGDHWDWEFDVSTQPPLQGTHRFPGTTGWNRLQDRFLGDPSLEKRFYLRLGELLDETFLEAKLWPRLERLREELAEGADEDRRRWGGNPDWRGAIDQVKRYITQRRAFLLSQLPGGESRAPRNLEPRPGALVETYPIRLQASGFSHQDPQVVHRRTRWQLRSERSGYSTPLVDETSEKDLDIFLLEQGVVFPGSTYFFRASHTGSNGKTSAWSAETSFRTGSFELRTVRFDLSRHFNRDVVANPGDRTSDALDDLGGRYIEEGFDGFRRDNPAAQGLPHDRVVGIHLLGDYSKPNVLQLGPEDRSPVRILVEKGSYSWVRFLVAGGAGDTEMVIVFEYAGGSRESQVLPADDWYDDNPPEGPAGSVHSGAVPILNDLDRMREGRFKDRNDPALFEVALRADPRKVLQALVLEPAAAKREKQGRSRFNLFAATGIMLGAPPER